MSSTVIPATVDYWSQVLNWLEDELELGEYRRAFSKAKVDGALLLNLEVGSPYCDRQASTVAAGPTSFGGYAVKFCL